MQLKILSWNIWFDGGRFEEICKFLKESKANIIGLQEVILGDQRQDIVGYLTKLGYDHVFAGLKIKDGRMAGNAVFSRQKILSRNTYVLSERDARFASRVDVEVGKSLLHVFNTHLVHTHQKHSDLQELQAKNLSKLLALEHSVVMGDFNATPDSTVVTSLSKIMVNSDPSLKPTWSVYPEGCPVCKPKAIDVRLDYIFTTPDIKLLRQKSKTPKRQITCQSQSI